MAQKSRMQKSGKVRWHHLLAFVSRRHYILLLAALLFSTASGIVVPALAVLLGRIFDTFTNFGAAKIDAVQLVDQVSNYAIALTCLGCISGLLNAIFYTAWLILGELQANNARHCLFASLKDKDMAWFDTRPSGIEALIVRLQSQIRELQLASSQPLGFLIQYTVTSIVALGLALYYSWRLTLVTLSTVPISTLILSQISARVPPNVEAQSAELMAAAQITLSSLRFSDVVTCYNGQQHEVNKYVCALARATKFYARQVVLNALQVGLVRFVTLAMFVQGFWYGSHLVSSGSQTAGQVLTAFWAALMAMQSIEQILPQLLVLEKGRAAGWTLRTIHLHLESGRKISSMKGQSRVCSGDIHLRNVSFAYPGHAQVLDQISLLFSAGETTFVIGQSGSGKSTLGNLLLCLYSIFQGDIFFGGQAIQTIDLEVLRSQITLVQQHSVLFDGTIQQNLALGNRHKMHISAMEIKTAMDLACLDDSQGIARHVNGATSLSGGQCQRVALARARIRDSPILILDEATSALDQKTKVKVVSAIREWRRGKTTIVITHDLSQISPKDYVYVLENGRVKREGFWSAVKYAPDLPITVPSSWPLPPVPLQVYHDAQIFPKTHLPRPLCFSFGQTAKTRQSRAKPLTEGELNQWLEFWHSSDRSQHESSQEHRLDQMSAKPTYSLDSLPVRSSIETLGPKAPSLTTSRSAQSLNGNSWVSPVAPCRESSEQSHAKNGSPRDQYKSLGSIFSTLYLSLDHRQRLVLLLGFLSATIHAAATPLFAWVFAKLLTTFFSDASNRSHLALRYSLYVLAVALADGISSFFMHFSFEQCGQAWINDIRRRAFRQLLLQTRQKSPESLTDILDRGAEETRNLVARFLGLVYAAMVMSLAAVVWSIVLNWRLTLVGLAAAPYICLVTRVFERVNGLWEKKANAAASRVESIFSETFGKISTVKALLLERHFEQKHRRAAAAALQVGYRRAAFSCLLFGLADSAILFVTALIFYYGARLATVHDTASLLTVFSMLLFTVANVNSLLAFVPQINASRAAAQQLLSCSDSDSVEALPANVRISTVQALPTNVELCTLPGSLINVQGQTGYTALNARSCDERLEKASFSNVRFAYPARPDHFVYSRLSLELNLRETTAIVGPSGCGKSTLASLLLGLHRPAEGEILIDGHTLEQLDLVDFRLKIGYVPQQPCIFPGSIAENISYARNVDMARVEHAATEAGIAEFVASLPEGYATQVGSGGMGLSGGQQQRICIARALLREPQLLILDEATSALDDGTAEHIRQIVVKCKARDVGVLAICHDPDMMRVCARVISLA